MVQDADVGIPDQLFSLVALIAVANGAPLTMIMASRLVFGMAEQRLLPAAGPRPARPPDAVGGDRAHHPGGDGADAGRRPGRPPHAVVLLLLLVFLSTKVAVLVLRRERVEQEHFRAPAVVPVLAISSCLLLLRQQEGRTWLLAGAELAVGLLLHLVVRAPWWSGRRGGPGAVVVRAPWWSGRRGPARETAYPAG